MRAKHLWRPDPYSHRQRYFARTSPQGQRPCSRWMPSVGGALILRFTQDDMVTFSLPVGLVNEFASSIERSEGSLVGQIDSLVTADPSLRSG